jgi:hypothetical protein
VPNSGPTRRHTAIGVSRVFNLVGGARHSGRRRWSEAARPSREGPAALQAHEFPSQEPPALKIVIDRQA